jgi:membrane-bound ClpP family serine protease
LALLVVLLFTVRRWVALPAWFVWGLLALWVVKDVMLFPFLWRSYAGERPGEGSSMVGLQGRAVERLAPSGFVKVRGELWRAEVTGSGRAVERKEAVRVQGMRGLTLLVTPEKEKRDVSFH